jgi:hypothetical protein
LFWTSALPPSPPRIIEFPWKSLYWKHYTCHEKVADTRITCTERGQSTFHAADVSGMERKNIRSFVFVPESERKNVSAYKI